MGQALSERLPPLRRPLIVGWLLAVVAVGLAWLCTFGPRNPQWVMTEPAVAMICLFFIGPLAAFFGVVGVWLTTPLAVVWDRKFQTVGELARAVTAITYGDPPRTHNQWSDEQIWSKLRQIIVDVLSVDPEKVTPEARFVEDLGAG
jgi:hypothetical protein